MKIFIPSVIFAFIAYYSLIYYHTDFTCPFQNGEIVIINGHHSEFIQCTVYHGIVFYENERISVPIDLIKNVRN